MTQRFVSGAALAALVSLVAAPGNAGNLSLTTNVDGDKDVVSCEDFNMKFWKDDMDRGDVVTVRRNQTVTVRQAGGAPLRVKATDQGGVWVQPSADGTFTAVICQAAGAKSQASANALLDKLQIVNEGGELRVRGPALEDWAAYIILSVPRNVSLDMSAKNGGLELRGVSGKFTLNTLNGPISVKNVSGNVVAKATNGPIEFVGHGGDMDLRAENGPVSVKLDAPSWSGKGLDASTQNGPIKVTTPRGLSSGVEVRGSESSPFSGHGDEMNWDDDDWSNGRTVRLGKGPVLVRVSTVNGPVEIRAADKGAKSRI